MKARQTIERPAVREVDRTIVFSDVVSSTQIVERCGDLRWAELIESHRRSVDAICRRHCGTVVGFTGDGVMLAFERPADGVGCALRMQLALHIQGQLGVRIGVNHGPVIPLGDGNYVGLTAHIASRYCDLSAMGEVVIDDGCYLAAGMDLPLPELELRSVAVRGLSCPKSVRVSAPPVEPWVR